MRKLIAVVAVVATALPLASTESIASVARPASPSHSAERRPAEWTSVTVGFSSCGIRTDHTLWCWGYPDVFPDGASELVRRPTRLGRADDWRTISNGGGHYCGTRGRGALWCWGDNHDGELGDGTLTSRDRPTRIGSHTDWRSVVATSSRTCGIRSGGTLWCWGDNEDGQLGDGTTEDRAVPTQVGNGGGWRTVTASTHHTCAIRGAGKLWCWGRNVTGVLGAGRDGDDRLRPLRIGDSDEWKKITAGSYLYCYSGDGCDQFAQSCGIRRGGSLWCWGSGYWGQLGTGDSRDRRRPTRISANRRWTSVKTGNEHTCARQLGGSLWCWGWNFYGSLGIGPTGPRLRPTKVDSRKRWSAIAVSEQFEVESSCGIAADRTLWCWGSNRWAQLGDGTTTDRDRPTRVRG